MLFRRLERLVERGNGHRQNRTSAQSVDDGSDGLSVMIPVMLMIEIGLVHASRTYYCSVALFLRMHWLIPVIGDDDIT